MPPLQKRIHFWLVGWLGARLVAMLHATWRMRVVDPYGVRSSVFHKSPPMMVAFWHRNILIMLAHHFNFPVCVPVSEHRDGEYVAQVMEHSGLASVRGSSTHGGLKAARAALVRMREGYTLAITPDGPRGPRYSVQPGFAVIAKRAGTPVCPIGMAADRGWELSSWDAFLIPRPFARVGMVFGKPLLPADFNDPTEYAHALRMGLESATEEAERVARS